MMKDVIVAVETTAGALLKRVVGAGTDDGTILLDAIGCLGGSVVARIDLSGASSLLPAIKKARRVVGILYDVQHPSRCGRRTIAAAVARVPPVIAW
jgi:hypothetical protein